MKVQSNEIATERRICFVTNWTGDDDDDNNKCDSLHEGIVFLLL